MPGNKWTWRYSINIEPISLVFAHGQQRTPASRPKTATKPASPGRPKDLGKRAAILEAAKRLFSDQGFDGASMDQIAAEAGVSKLTVYSHFGDKEALFSAAVRAKCEEMLPDDLFAQELKGPLRDASSRRSPAPSSP